MKIKILFVIIFSIFLSFCSNNNLQDEEILNINTEKYSIHINRIYQKQKNGTKQCEHYESAFIDSTTYDIYGFNMKKIFAFTEKTNEKYIKLPNLYDNYFFEINANFNKNYADTVNKIIAQSLMQKYNLKEQNFKKSVECYILISSKKSRLAESNTKKSFINFTNDSIHFKNSTLKEIAFTLDSYYNDVFFISNDSTKYTFNIEYSSSAQKTLSDLLKNGINNNKTIIDTVFYKYSHIEK